MGHDPIHDLLRHLRATVSTGCSPQEMTDLFDQFEGALARLVSERDTLRARLERPLNPRPLSSPDKLEELVRRLESPGTVDQ